MKVVLLEEDVIELHITSNFLAEEETDFGWFCHGFCLALQMIFGAENFPKYKSVPQREVIRAATRLLQLKDEVMTRAGMYLMDESIKLESRRKQARSLRAMIEEMLKNPPKEKEEDTDG